LITELLERTTGDIVHVRPIARKCEQVHGDDRLLSFMLDSRPPARVGLLSDGLDSLCGAHGALNSGSDRFAFISILTNPSRKNRIKQIQTELHNLVGERAAFHVVDLHLRRPPRFQERTQRSRTVLSVIAGLTAATGLGSKEIEIYENGFGLLNPPVPNMQMQHESSQVLNPAHRDAWMEVSRRLLGSVDIVYPNRWRTKGEMCERLPEDVRQQIRLTSSCDAPSRTESVPNCGTCGSCIIRRVSLASAGLSHYDVPYRYYRPTHRAYDPIDVLPYHASLLLQSITEPDPWPALVRLQPTIGASVDNEADSVARLHAITATVDLIRRQVAEILGWEGLNEAA
jgi:7-cyano-7-deazaguanine synthase in queuosine biosynthesis